MSILAGPATSHPVDLSGLNAQQRAAVCHGGGPLVVIAGAGSGKTRVLTTRIAHLVTERGVDAASVLAITFTNKAAREMKERLETMLGSATLGRMQVATFHSAFLRVLRCYPEAVGLRDGFTIFDTDDCAKLVENVTEDLGYDPKTLKPRGTLGAISAAKNALVSPAALARSASGRIAHAHAHIYGAYQLALLRNNAVDFDDILVHTVTLFTTHADVLAMYQDRWQHILVDEYQDTNIAQNNIVGLLGAIHRNVTVVGDPDQAIYGFRGAKIANILTFGRVFPEATTIALEQNYRSTATILDAANEVIQNNPGRPEKNLWTDTADGARIVVHTSANGLAEAAWIADEVGALRGRGVRGPDIAVLCRGKVTGRGVEEALLAAGIPCVFSGAVAFFERAHIKDLLAYLRLVVNRADELAFRRIVNTPRRSVGPASIRKLRTWARYRDLDIDEAMKRCAEVDELPAKATEGLLGLHQVLETARAQNAAGVGPDEVLADIIDATGYLAHVEQSAKGSQQHALEGVERLLVIAGGHASVLSLLEIAELSSQWDQDAAGDVTDERVVIMTIHGAKGLEWPVVFVPAMEEGVFPDARCTSGPELEEERRLAYVAITRAKQRLYLSHAQSRMRFGSSERNKPSRFLGEIPAHLVSGSR